MHLNLNVLIIIWETLFEKKYYCATTSQWSCSMHFSSLPPSCMQKLPCVTRPNEVPKMCVILTSIPLARFVSSPFYSIYRNEVINCKFYTWTYFCNRRRRFNRCRSRCCCKRWTEEKKLIKWKVHKNERQN